MSRIKQTKEELNKTHKKIEELEKKNESNFIGRWFNNLLLEGGFFTILFIGIPFTLLFIITGVVWIRISLAVISYRIFGNPVLDDNITTIFLIILIFFILSTIKYTKQKKEIIHLNRRREILIKRVKKKEKQISERKKRKHQLNNLTKQKNNIEKSAKKYNLSGFDKTSKILEQETKKQINNNKQLNASLENLKFVKKQLNKIEQIIEKKDDEENLKIRENFIASQKKKDLALYSFENKEYWLSNKIINELNMIKKHIDTNFMQINPYDFEEFTKHLFGQMSYSAIQTKNTGDFGADVIAKKGEDTVLIQCKRNSVGNNVSNVIVQQTLGAMWKYEANKSIIVTTSDFTVSAHHQARNAPVELWNGTYFKKIVKEILIEEVVKKEGTIDKEEIK